MLGIQSELCGFPVTKDSLDPRVFQRMQEMSSDFRYLSEERVRRLCVASWVSECYEKNRDQHEKFIWKALAYRDEIIEAADFREYTAIERRSIRFPLLFEAAELLR